MSRPKFHKLYFPGLISLVLLPIMCIFYLVSKNAFHKYRVMDIAWQSKESLNEWAKFSHQKINVETYRKYKTLPLTGNEKHDPAEKNNLPFLIRQLNQNKDTVNGISVLLTDKTQYAELVVVLDICYKEQEHNQQFNFIPVNNKILMYYLNPTTVNWDNTGKTWCLCNDVIYSRPTESFISMEKIEAGLRNTYKTLVDFCPSVTMFILLILFALFKSKRYLNLKTFRLQGY